MDKRPHFLSEELAGAVVDELHYRRTAQEMKLFCYCIMPEHLHLLVSLSNEYNRSLQNWIAAFKRHTSKVARERFGIKPLWQKNFHEHIVRKEESLLRTAEYILNNPVRRGIVPQWDVYPFCGMPDALPLD